MGNLRHIKGCTLGRARVCVVGTEGAWGEGGVYGGHRGVHRRGEHGGRPAMHRCGGGGGGGGWWESQGAQRGCIGAGGRRAQPRHLERALGCTERALWALRGSHGRSPGGSRLPPHPCPSLPALHGGSARRVRRCVPGLQRATTRSLCQCPVIKMSPFNFQASRSNLFLIKSLIETLLPPASPGRAAEEAVKAQSRCGSIERSPD